MPFLPTLFLSASLAGAPQKSLPAAVNQMAATTSTRIAVPGVDNLFQVNTSLFRGAQPSELGLEQLKKLGVTVIVNLRERGQVVDTERNQAEALGLRYVSIPVDTWAPPTNGQVAQFLTMLQSSPGDKFFVHCHLGRDRTGVMVAAYRVAEQHWTAGQAIHEMESVGFRAIREPLMWAFVDRFPKAFASDSVFQPLRALAS
jgi:tyrosine-protein phosphatase SIW14